MGELFEQRGNVEFKLELTSNQIDTIVGLLVVEYEVCRDIVWNRDNWNEQDVQECLERCKEIESVVKDIEHQVGFRWYDNWVENWD